MSDELQDLEEYIGRWIERADEMIDEKEAELDALIAKRNEAADAIGRDARADDKFEGEVLADEQDGDEDEDQDDEEEEPG